MDQETFEVWIGQVIALQAAVVALFAQHSNRAALRRSLDEAFAQVRPLIAAHDPRGDALDAAEQIYEKLCRELGEQGAPPAP